MARHLIQSATTGDARIVGDAALAFFPGYAIVDTYDDGVPPAVFYGAGESDLRYVNVTELSDPASAASVTLRAAFARLELGALGKVRSGLAARVVTPFRVVFAGSSTTAGSWATTEEDRYVNRVVRSMQRAYPSGIRGESPVLTVDAAYTAPSAKPGVHGYNAGLSGSNSSNYLSDTTVSRIGTLGANLVVHMISSNDFAGNVAPATFKANVLSRITALKAAIARPHVHLLVQPYERYDGTFTYPWAAYATAMREIAEADPDNVAFADISQPYYLTGIPGTDPLDLLHGDAIHQWDSGHALMADLICRALGIPPGSPRTPGTLLAWDSFARADSASLGAADSGQTWVAPSGGDIVNKQASAAHAVLPVPCGDVDVRLTAIWNGAGTPSTGVNFYFADASNRMVFYHDGGATLVLAKVDAGTLINLATAALAAPTSGTILRMQVVTRGDQVVCLVDGKQVMPAYTLTSAEMTKYRGNQQFGLRIGAAGARFDHIEILAA